MWTLVMGQYQSCHVLLEMGLLQRGPHLLVRVVAEGVEVHPEGAGEEDGVLRDDGELAAEVVQPELRDGPPVYLDAALRGLHQPEQGHGERGLAGPGPAHDADLLAPGHRGRYLLDHQVQTLPVPQPVVGELNLNTSTYI